MSDLAMGTSMTIAGEKKEERREGGREGWREGGREGGREGVPLTRGELVFRLVDEGIIAPHNPVGLHAHLD